MPGFKYIYSPEQIAAIAAYVKTLPPGTQDLPPPGRHQGSDAGSVTISSTWSHMGSHFMKTKAHSVAVSLIVLVIVCGTTGVFPGAARADSLFTAPLPQAAGEKMGGVTVSAKAEGSTVTDERLYRRNGNYYFRHCLTVSIASGRKR